MSTKSLDDTTPPAAPGWLNVRRSIYVGARASLQVLQTDARYELERYHDDNVSETRRAKRDMDGLFFT
jgi:hypothetical protein